MSRARFHLLLSMCVFAVAAKADIVSVSPSNLDFGSQVLTTSAVQPVVLYNLTKKDLNISGVTITGDFSVSSNSCGAILPAGQSCAISVVFAPTAAGLRTGLLSISDDANNTPQKVKLSGTAIPLQMTSITVTPGNPTVGLGLNVQFAAIGKFNDGTTQDLTGSAAWTSSATGVATIASGGLASSVHQGTTTITAASSVATTTGALSGSTVLTVGPPVLQSLSVTYAPSLNGNVIPQGMTLQFTAKGTFSDQTIKDVTASVQWSSSDPSAATVSTTGLVTGKSPGLPFISASSGSALAGYGVTVVPPALTSIAITPANASIAEGTSLQFTATGTFTDSSTQNITNTAQWFSPGGVPISATGVATAGVYPGVVTIEASGYGFNGRGIIGQTTLEVGNAFNVSASMSTARFFHTATLVSGGKVLLAGGAPSISGNPVSSTELYDPVANTFTPGGGMSIPRARHTATLLASGKVLMAGGSNGSGAITSAEVYDPATQTFGPTASMGTPRSDLTATLLLNGQVLIAGGSTATAELYDPSAGAFTSTGSMSTWRRGHTATLLGNGKVLITGGLDSAGVSTAAAELYDPDTKLFSSAGNMTGARAFHRATLINGGKVLLTGGSAGFGSWTPQAELYDPVAGLFTATGVMIVARDTHSATLLPNGQVLIVGGEGATGVLATAEKYDPASGTFVLIAAPINVHFDPTRIGHTTTVLSNGWALVAGGSLETGAGVYEPRILIPPGLMSITVAPAIASIAVGTSQRFVATGTFQDNSSSVLMSVFWLSSNSAVATISNDAGSLGIAAGAGAGSSVIEAMAGAFPIYWLAGTATLTVH